MRQKVRVGHTNTAILRGELDIGTWSDEELIRGQRRAVTGQFKGRPPKVVPKAIHDELVRRKLSKAYDLLKDSLVDAVVLLRTVVTDPDAQYADRIKAAKIIMDRVLGKATERVELGFQEPPWATALRSALQVAPVTGIISASSLEEDEDDE